MEMNLPRVEAGSISTQQTLFPHLDLSCMKLSKAVPAIVISRYTTIP